MNVRGNDVQHVKGTGHGARGTGHGAQGTGHRAQSESEEEKQVL